MCMKCLVTMKTCIVFLVLFLCGTRQCFLIDNFEHVLDFGLKYYDQFNFDGLLGFTIAEAQLINILNINPNDEIIRDLLRKCQILKSKIRPLLQKTPKKMIVLEKYLLETSGWIFPIEKPLISLTNYGIYKNWTRETILNNKHAEYKGVVTDHCLLEILNFDCYISSFCAEMMLAQRVDTGYLLSHRLFYLQIIRLKKCPINHFAFHLLSQHYCSLMLREANTNELLGFPGHDIFLEQMVLCGIEGYTEFLNLNWTNKVIEWQKMEGCFESEAAATTTTTNDADLIAKRSSNIIVFGCNDHTTGLGAAALALLIKQHIFQMIY